MKLKGRDWGFIAVAGGVVLALVVLSTLGKKAKPMTAGPHHAGLSTATKREECLACHDPTREGAIAPLPASHPLVWKKQEVSCVVCHAPPGGAALARSAHSAAPPVAMVPRALPAAPAR